MKKHLLIPILLTFCSLQSFAQYQATSDVGGHIMGAAAPSGTLMLVNGTNASTGTNSVIIGNAAGISNTGGQNTIVGQGTGWTTSGSNNTFLGAWTAQANLGGYLNTFVGFYCGSSNTTGGENTFLGSGAGRDNIGGHKNTFIGGGAGTGSIGGSNNTALGNGATFSSGSFNNSTVIGANAVCSNSNVMILGGAAGSGSDVKVGIGTSDPQAHIHTKNDASENIIFSTNNMGIGSASKLDLQTLSGTSLQNSLQLVMNGTTNTGTLLPAWSTPVLAPVSMASVSGLFTNTSSLAFGPQSPENTTTVHFVNTITNSSGFITAECMRVNKNNGFVGIHTRTSALAAATTGKASQPLSLFHVNLTNPVNDGFDPLTQGIRFEGLPASQTRHTETVVIDPITGDLARSSSGSGPGNDWHINGNSGTAPSHWIGTIDPDDFRIRTNNTPRARFTDNGNFDLGSNTFAAATATSAAIGTNNQLTGALGNATISSFASGTGNTMRNVDNSMASGATNSIVGSDYAQALGLSNVVDASPGALASGQGNQLKTSSSNSHAMGKENFIDNSTNALASGDANSIFNAAHNSNTLGSVNTIDHSQGAMASGKGNLIIDNSDNSHALGETDTIQSSDNVLALGKSHYITFSEESVAAGERDTIVNGHGTFIGGGHNYAKGTYNFIGGEHNSISGGHNTVILGDYNTSSNGLHAIVLGDNNTVTTGAHNVLLGNNLTAEIAATAMPSPLSPDNSIMLIGTEMHSDLNRSLTIGFEANRTMVTTKTGVAIQLNPNALNTYQPVVNFEVDCYDPSLGASPGPQGIGIPRSNIRFHNLPPAPSPLSAVVIDTLTGELFFTRNSTYFKQGVNSNEEIDALVKENEVLKTKMAQLESMLSKYDEKFASLEKSINQICETGCAGLNTHLNDELFQSVPNPTSSNVNIGYFLAKTYTNASISIVNVEGKVVSTFPLNPAKGNGSINVSLNELQSGVYMYQLVVDGRQVGAKKLLKQ